MRTSTILLLGCLAMAAVAASADEFDDFKVKFGKTYSEVEEGYRRFVFYENMKTVQALNAFAKAEGKQTVHNVTMFMDQTPAEFAYSHRNYKSKPVPKMSEDFEAVYDPAVMKVDWRDKGCITPVKNQGQCGSCWAFSATETIESFWNLAGNPLTKLSTQQITACTGGGQYGCNGGYTSAAYNYVEQAGGVDSASSYPYTAGGGNTGQCMFNPNNVVAKISNWGNAATNGNEQALQGALTNKGPISVCVDASSWQFYTGGIMQQCGQQIDHCVQAVGFNKNSNPPYYIVRNSWTTQWGIDGYIYVEMGQNLCAIADDATYVDA